MDGRRNRMTAVDNGRVVSVDQNAEDCVKRLPLCGRAPEVTSCMLRHGVRLLKYRGNLF